MKQFKILFRHFQGMPVAILLGMCLVLVNSVHSSPFTYQGRLTDGGVVPSTSQYNSPLSFGMPLQRVAKVAVAIILAPVTTTNGVFTVVLDFGDSAFNGEARWLQISVPANGSVQPYQVLTPRPASFL